jgi:hypothetical protein
MVNPNSCIYWLNLRKHCEEASVSVHNLTDNDQFAANILTLNNYYPYGMLQAGRSASSGTYRFGYQGQEMDNAISGTTGTHTTAQFWEYDTRAVKRWNTDPKPNPAWSDYAVFGGNPILFSDVLGDTIVINLHHEEDPMKYDANAMVKKQTNDGIFLVLTHSNPNLVGDRNGDKLRTGEAIHNALIAADKAQNFNEDGSYRYGGKSYEQQVNNEKKVQVILYSCATSCYKDMRGVKVAEGDMPIARKFSAYLSEKNASNLVTGANGDVAIERWRILPLNKADQDNPTKQTGAWVTYEAGKPKYIRPLKFHLEKGQPYIMPDTKIT